MTANVPPPASSGATPAAGQGHDECDLLRVMDANANRAGEGLRVVEEYVRFVLDDAHLSQLSKQLRHDIQLTVERQAPAAIAARDTVGDVGTTLQTPQEYDRQSIQHVVAANLKRCEQALRCLEEYAKPLAACDGAAFEQLRYRAYELSRAVLTTDDSRRRLATARLYVLLDANTCGEQFEQRLTNVADCADVVQLRDKQLDDRVLLERARVAREITRRTETLLIVNDRPDLAVLAHADGVHLGQGDLTVRDARRVVGATPLIGVSTHTIQQARQAVLDGANYLGCGPTFPSTTKDFKDFPGLPFLEQVQAEIRLPCFAIGGIDDTNLPQVLACGFERVVIGGFLRGPQPAAKATWLRRALHPNQKHEQNGPDSDEVRS